MWLAPHSRLRLHSDQYCYYYYISMDLGNSKFYVILHVYKVKDLLFDVNEIETGEKTNDLQDCKS